MINYLIMTGDGGLARVLTDILEARGNSIAFFIGTKQCDLLGRPCYSLEDWQEKEERYSISPAFPYVLGMANPIFRERYVEILGKDNFTTITDGFISNYARIGYASILMPDSYIMNNATIEPYTHVHIGTMVGHDSTIGEYSFIGPKVVIGGGCTIGRRCRIGMRASVLPKITIGEDVTIAAGSMVIKDIPSGITVAGNPAKEISKTDFAKW